MSLPLSLMVNSRAPQCHPIVDSRLEEELAVPTLSPPCRQQARKRSKPSQHVWEAAHRPPPLPVPAASVAKPWTTRTRHAQTLPSVRQSATRDQRPQTARRPHRAHTRSPPTQDTARHSRLPPRAIQPPPAVEDAASAAQSAARSRPNRIAPCLAIMSLSIARRHNTVPYPCPCL